jgi:hypothetical protein
LAHLASPDTFPEFSPVIHALVLAAVALYALVGALLA